MIADPEPEHAVFVRRLDAKCVMIKADSDGIKMSDLFEVERRVVWVFFENLKIIIREVL